MSDLAFYNKSKVYIFGDGCGYNRLMSLIDRYSDYICVEGVITTDIPKYSQIDGYPCFKADVLKDHDFDFVIVTPPGFKMIKQYLESITEKVKNKIIQGRVFELPFFDWIKYINIMGRCPSLISHNCLSGVIYNELGLYVNVPIYNCFCRKKDYWKFLNHIRSYLNSDMVYSEQNNLSCWEGDKPNVFVERAGFIPKGIVKDLVVFFNHTDDENESISKWNVKRKEVNYDNLVVLAEIHDENDLFEFNRINYKKIGFSVTNFNHKDIVYIHEWKEDLCLRRKYAFNWGDLLFDYITNRNGYPSKINWINFLYDGNDYLRF